MYHEPEVALSEPMSLALCARELVGVVHHIRGPNPHHICQILGVIRMPTGK